jgi:hypothetical protein
VSTFHVQRKRSIRTYVPCPVCGHKVCLQGTRIPVHGDHRFDFPGMRCPASGEGMVDAVGRLTREPA